MQNLQLDQLDGKSAPASTYSVSKKFFWPVILLLTGIFIVLLVLTIYFGVNQKSQNTVDNESRTTLTSTIRPPETTTSNALTTTMAPPLPVARIPDNLQQQFYDLTIAPDLNHETFTGKFAFELMFYIGGMYLKDRCRLL
jgi:hypothetical protein